MRRDWQRRWRSFGLLIGDPPACVREACIEDIEEFARYGLERCVAAVDMGDGSGAGDGVDDAVRVVTWLIGSGFWRGIDLTAGVQDSRGIDPPDELICRDHIRTFQGWDRRSGGSAQVVSIILVGIAVSG